MNQKFDIDELFRETFANATDVPPTSAWNHISGELDQLSGLSNASASKVGAKIWFGKLGISAKLSIIGGVLAVATAVFVFNQQSKVATINNKFSDNSNKSENPKDRDHKTLLDDMDAKDSEVAMPIQNSQVLNGGVSVEKSERPLFDSSYIQKLIADQDKNSDKKSNLGVTSEGVIVEAEKLFANGTDKNMVQSCKNMMHMEHVAVSGSDKFVVNAELEMTSLKMYFGDGETFVNAHVESKEFTTLHGYRVRLNKDFYVKSIVNFKNGCVDSAMTRVEVMPTISKSEELIPNVFTPNGDGKNDEYFVQIAEPLNYSMLILDMRKNKVFYSENSLESWKGDCGINPCEGGFYEMILKLKYSGEPEMIINKRINLVRKGIE